MKQLFLLIGGVMVFIAAVGLLTQKLNGTKPTPVSEKKTIKVGMATVSVDLAKTESERRNGLSKVTSLPENQGMLFVFDKKDVTPTFWMKDMLIPLDIIWINDDIVVKIDKGVPPPEPGTPDSKLLVYTPGKPVDFVLEVNSGFSDKNNLNIGDKVDLSGI